nr:hypothetical protein [Clostridia bacterium]
MVNSVGIKWHIPEEIDIHHLKKLRKKLYAKADNNNLFAQQIKDIERVRSKGQLKP